MGLINKVLGKTQCDCIHDLQSTTKSRRLQAALRLADKYNRKYEGKGYTGLGTDFRWTEKDENGEAVELAIDGNGKIWPVEILEKRQGRPQPCGYCYANDNTAGSGLKIEETTSDEWNEYLELSGMDAHSRTNRSAATERRRTRHQSVKERHHNENRQNSHQTQKMQQTQPSMIGVQDFAYPQEVQQQQYTMPVVQFPQLQTPAQIQQHMQFQPPPPYQAVAPQFQLQSQASYVPQNMPGVHQQFTQQNNPSVRPTVPVQQHVPVQQSTRQTHKSMSTVRDPLDSTVKLPLGARGQREHIPGQSMLNPEQFGRLDDPDANYRHMKALDKLRKKNDEKEKEQKGGPRK